MPEHYLYVIASAPEGPVKLGRSRDPDRRARQLQTGHVGQLAVFHREPLDAERAALFERLLHRDWRHRRCRAEWFAMSVADAIAAVRFTVVQYALSPLDALRRQLSSRRPKTVDENGFP